MNGKRAKELRRVASSLQLPIHTSYQNINHGMKVVKGVPTFPVTVKLADNCERSHYQKLKKAYKMAIKNK